MSALQQIKQVDVVVPQLTGGPGGPLSAICKFFSDKTSLFTGVNRSVLLMEPFELLMSNYADVGVLCT